MARKKTAADPTGDLAPRPRGHRSLVTKRDLQAYRRRLEAELAELRAQRADLEESTEASLADATGEVGFDEEFADAGSFTFERERDLSLVDNAKDLIDKVEHALARIDSGSFGRCEACGGAVDAERLDALPYATLCLADAQARPAAVTMAEPGATGRSRRALALYGTAAVVLALDQLTKHLVVSNLAGRPPVDLVDDVVQLRYTTNSGGAFSLLTGAPLFFGIMALVIIGGIVYASRRAQPLSMLVILGLILGGALGNLTDRLLRGDALLRGEVVDFIKVGIWPVFNLADSCVVVGGILLALFLGKAERESEQAPADTDRA